MDIKKKFSKDSVVVYKAQLIIEEGEEVKINTHADTFGLTKEDAIRELIKNTLTIEDWTHIMSSEIDKIVNFPETKVKKELIGNLEYQKMSEEEAKIRAKNLKIAVIEITIDNPSFFLKNCELEDAYKDGMVLLSLKDYEESNSTYSMKATDETSISFELKIDESGANLKNLKID